jgi:hypothetical protein
MPFRYATGEEIRQGDRVLHCGTPGEVEFVVDAVTNPESWFVSEYGGGAMILDQVAGRTFLPEPEGECLVFVSRGS